jgi:hypothetical protein
VGGYQRIRGVPPLHGEATPRQQLGRTRKRDRAGSTGRAGRSRAGKRQAGFFIGRFPLASNSYCNSRETGNRASVPDCTTKSNQITLCHGFSNMAFKHAMRARTSRECPGECQFLEADLCASRPPVGSMRRDERSHSSPAQTRSPGETTFSRFSLNRVGELSRTMATKLAEGMRP